MLTREPGSGFLIDQGSTHIFEFICGHTHSLSAAADQNTAGVLAAIYFFRYGDSIVGIVYGIRRVSSEILWGITSLFQNGFNCFFCLITCMITGNGYCHLIDLKLRKL